MLRYKQDANIIIALPIRRYFKHFKVIGLEPIIDNFPLLLLSELLFASFLTFFKNFSNFELVENVGAAPLFHLPKMACYCYTTFSIYEALVETSTPREGSLMYSGTKGIRTPTPLRAKQVRFQLRHSPTFSGRCHPPFVSSYAATNRGIIGFYL